MNGDFKITLIQTDLVWEDRVKNLSHFERLFRSVNEETDLILLPETFNTGFSINHALCAENMDGPSIGFLRKMANDRQASVMTSLIIREQQRVINRLVIISPDGLIETYDKRHLFRLSEEYRLFDAGMHQATFMLKGWNIRPIICYDLRFPVWCRNTYSDTGYDYDLLVCIANWPASRAHVWKTLLMARAIENQAYAIGVNRIGYDGHGTGHSGDSLVSDAKGNLMFLAQPGEQAVHTLTLSAEDLTIFRQSFTVGMDWDSFTITQ
jgi:predicted amidohydrolase